jgi:hypothetical protein
VTDARRSSPYGRPVAEGTWLYSGSVPTAVRILESDAAFGTGDQDEPEHAEDTPGLCFYVEWEPPGGGSSGGSVTGPFPTIDEAKKHIQQTATGVRWGATISKS